MNPARWCQLAVWKVPGHAAGHRPRYYPFVTSSNCVAAAVPPPVPVSARHLHYVLGITKTYCTRVGGGGFPPSWTGENPWLAHGHCGCRKGTTTGRSRQCGWFDAALLKRSAQSEQPVWLLHRKLDVLDGLSELKLCTGYRLDGGTIDILPVGRPMTLPLHPIYETLPGWTQSTVGVTQQRQTAARSTALPATHWKSDRCAHSHGVHQPGSGSHHPVAPPIPNLILLKMPFLLTR